MLLESGNNNNYDIFMFAMPQKHERLADVVTMWRRGFCSINPRDLHNLSTTWAHCSKEHFGE